MKNYKYFLFGAAACAAMDEGGISNIDPDDCGEVYAYDLDEAAEPNLLLDAFSGYEDYIEIQEAEWKEYLTLFPG